MNSRKKDKKVKQHKRLIVIFFGLLLLLITPKQKFKTSSQALKQKEISYAAWWSGLYSQPDADLSLAKLSATGAKRKAVLNLGPGHSSPSP